MSDFFCPLPWKGIFVHTNRVSVCCASSTTFENTTPDKFLNSPYIEQLRNNFLNNRADSTCSFCIGAESRGQQSIRQHVVKLFNRDTVPELRYAEVRASNLCNYKCIMCNGENSSLISNSVVEMSDESWSQFLSYSTSLNYITLTGGEPFLIKKYYQLLDHLIENDRTDTVISIYTNCSVYNPVFIDKLLKFKTCNLNLSIDGIGRTAELQRSGCDWYTVDKNIRQIIQLPLNVKLHTTFTNVNILDVDSLIKYFNDILTYRNDLGFVAHSVGKPFELTIQRMQTQFIPTAIDSIDEALSIMHSNKYDQFRNELVKIKEQLVQANRKG